MFIKPNMKRHWARKYSDGFLGHEPDSTMVEAALKEALVPGSVLEIGAGAGHFSELMRDWGYEVTATDLVVGNTLDIAKERLGDFDNVVAMGVIHHILDHDKFLAAIANIKAMAQKRVILAVKLPSVHLKKRTRHANRYSVLDYIDVLGNPVTVTACGYLSLLEWKVQGKE
jgi:cyclopropane fatty-acyl-phospholipid synthase-like methyltransferase